LIWLALGAGLLALFVWLGRAASSGHGGDWRPAGAFLALIALLGGAVFGLRGAWAPALACLFAATAVATLSRRPTSHAPRKLEMSEDEARALLGVGQAASDEEVQTAYVRLMRRVHPDAGGASGLAAQLNVARDRLLEKRR